jgi:hypothetical protein
MSHDMAIKESIVIQIDHGCMEIEYSDRLNIRRSSVLLETCLSDVRKTIEPITFYPEQGSVGGLRDIISERITVNQHPTTSTTIISMAG